MSDDPRDCNGCGYAPLSPEEEERLRPERERFMAAIARQFEVLRQMQERSGPIYELARERSRIISEAYQAAGRPRRVSLVHSPHGLAYVFHVRRGGKWNHSEPATRDDADAWYGWWRERERLRRKLGIGQSRGAAPGLGRE